MIRFLILFLLILFKTEAQTSVLNIADSLYANGNYSKAIAQYQLYKNQPEVFSKIARAFMAIGNYDEALKNYEASINAQPDDALIKYEYAKLLASTKKYEVALKNFKYLIDVDDKNPNYHYELGMVLEKLNDSTAINQFQSAYDLDDTHQKAIYKIAKYNLQKRKHEIVDKYVDKGLETYANNLELISLKAQNQYWKQDYREAIKWFEKLIEMGESSEFVYEKLSLSYGKHYNYEKALENRLKAFKFNPNDATAIYVIGTYYLELNDFEKAEEYISKALLFLDKPLHAEYGKLATVLNHQKKYSEAIAALKTAIEEDPTNEYSHFHLAITLETYYADYDAKIKVYEDFKVKFPNSKMNQFADAKISKIKKEKFLKTD
ncbi:MAG: tetratricopeptide repeat protein [Flavobacteriaceae bacterium]|tara:strand:- start:13346 stop:14476 length:1131 start_codon:yes stop_codon:yes gene_type:complete